MYAVAGVTSSRLERVVALRPLDRWRSGEILVGVVASGSLKRKT